MSSPVKFEFTRPFTPRVVDIVYVSPPIVAVAYPSGSINGVIQF